jgi:hypothetical protein
MRRLLALLLCGATLAPAYYHFTRFQTRTGPFTPVYDRFDLTTLPNKTVSFYISERGPSQFAPGDTLAAVVSQVRAAANAWNAVDTSEIKLAFGGQSTAGQTANTPWIEVEFSDELPPGIIAAGGVVTRLDPITTANGTFVPIAKSLLRIPSNLSTFPSSSEAFFTTVVHEFGHTLGLQHSWTSGVMSTTPTRATTKSLPLSPDDMAGLSILYPTAAFGQQTGSLTGRVTLGGGGVNLASVVAFAPNRHAISTLTNPDGSYRIQGLPPGQYFIYVHPLPPALPGEAQPVNIDLPQDPSGRLVPGASFATTFYPGTAQPEQTVAVTSGQTVENVNFAVSGAAPVSLFGVTAYSYFGSSAVKPATVVLGRTIVSTVMTGNGIPLNGVGLSVSAISAPETISIRPYTSQFIIVDVGLSPVSSTGPRHLLFNYNNESYVLPSGLTMVAQDPPVIQTVTANPDHTLTLTGLRLSSATRVWMDGVPARIVGVTDGALVIAPPPAPFGYRSVIAALNPDGQSSLYDGRSVTYNYDAPEIPQIFVSPAALPAGAESMIEITGSSTDFTNWLPTLGLGSSDVSVLQIFPVSATRALAQVSVSPQASSAPVSLTTGTGLYLNSTPGGFQILPATRPLYLAASTLSRTLLYSGLSLSLPLVNASANANPGNSTVILTDRNGVDRAATIVGYTAGLLTVQLPGGLPAGPAVIRINLDGVQSLPAVVRIDPVPPVILSAQTVAGFAISATNPARPGDTIQVIATSLNEGNTLVDIARVHLSSQGVEHSVQSIAANPAVPGTYTIQFSLSQNSPNLTSLPLTLTIEDRPSQPFLLSFQR